MKIMKAVDKKVGDVVYYKYKINLPKKIVEDSKFEGKELNVKFGSNKIIIERGKS